MCLEITKKTRDQMCFTKCFIFMLEILAICINYLSIFYIGYLLATYHKYTKLYLQYYNLLYL